jgi:general secretion pathway protein K
MRFHPSVHTHVNAARKSACATRRGAALLAVLWLSAALSAIVFTVASRVRAETERTATDVDSLRAGYLATGAIDRALLYIQWGPVYKNPDGTPKYFQNPMPLLHFNFPTGAANVEIIPETAKLNVNLALPVEIRNLLLAIGVDPGQAAAITAAVIDWRSPTAGGAFSQFDQHYLSLAPSFQARHASLHEIEELLLIQGVTPDLFYGSYTRDDAGKLTRHPALRDCLSVFGSTGVIDVNTADPAVMRAIGITPDVIVGIVNRRRLSAIKDGDLAALTSAAGPLSGRLGIVPSVIVTLRATASLRLPDGKFSDMRRSVAAMVKFLGPGFDAPYHVLRWYDDVVAPQ